MTQRTATLRELNQRSGKIIAEVVATGDDVVVTDHGRPVARIIREEPVEDAWDRLIRLGDVVPASREWSTGELQTPSSGRTSAEILEELRADR